MSSHGQLMQRPGQLPALSPTTVKILIVADGDITLDPVSELGLGRAIDALRTSGAKIGYFSFDITLARHDGAPSVNAAPGPYDPTYIGFRFDQTKADGSPVLYDFDQVWCLGYNPGSALPDSQITLPKYLATDDLELKVITEWMNSRGGGIFATGDHLLAGASLSHRIPRVGAMRAWTTEQASPPFNGPDRFDTTQPATPGQLNIASGHPDPIPFDNETDSVPKPIMPRLFSYYALGVFEAPHPILSDPIQGPINVLPDHGHEGRVLEDAEVNCGRRIKVAGNEFAEFPGERDKPMPTAIAWANTTPAPPFNLKEGPSPGRRIAVVSVYDGTDVGVGRVVVDSTFHHWFNDNSRRIQEKAPDKYGLIVSYWRNIGLWLVRRDQRQLLLTNLIWTLLSSRRAILEFDSTVAVESLGKTALSILADTVSTQQLVEWLVDCLLDALGHAGWAIRSALRDFNVELRRSLGVERSQWGAELFLGHIVKELLDNYKSGLALLPRANEIDRTEVKRYIGQGLRHAVDDVMKRLENIRTAVENAVSTGRNKSREIVTTP